MPRRSWSVPHLMVTQPPRPCHSRICLWKVSLAIAVVSAAHHRIPAATESDSAPGRGVTADHIIAALVIWDSPGTSRWRSLPPGTKDPP